MQITTISLFSNAVCVPHASNGVGLAGPAPSEIDLTCALGGILDNSPTRAAAKGSAPRQKVATRRLASVCASRFRMVLEGRQRTSSAVSLGRPDKIRRIRQQP